jgi:hypothetical protein
MWLAAIANTGKNDQLGLIARPGLITVPAEKPATGGDLEAQPECGGWHVLARRGHHSPASRRRRRLIGRRPRRSLDHRDHRVQPTAPDEPARPFVDQPHVGWLWPHPAHLPARLATRAAGSCLTPWASYSTRRSTGYPGEDRQLILVRNYIRSACEKRELMAKMFGRTAA